VLTIARVPASKVIIDTGAQPEIVGRHLHQELEACGYRFENTGLRLSQAGGRRAPRWAPAAKRSPSPSTRGPQRSVPSQCGWWQPVPRALMCC